MAKQTILPSTAQAHAHGYYKLCIITHIRTVSKGILPSNIFTIPPIFVPLNLKVVFLTSQEIFNFFF